MEELERELKGAQEDLSAGSTMTRAGAGDAQADSRVDKSPEERIKLLYKALNRLDAVRYPIADITPIDRTKIIFSMARDTLTNI